MATYGWPDFIFKIDATDGGSLQSMVAHIREISIGGKSYNVEENTVAGSTWEAHLLTGIRKLAPITITGVYDDTAGTGPNATFNGTHAVTRSCEITWGGSKTTSFEAWMTDFTRIPKAKGKLDYSVTIQPTGTVSEV